MGRQRPFARRIAFPASLAQPEPEAESSEGSQAESSPRKSGLSPSLRDDCRKRMSLRGTLGSTFEAALAQEIESATQTEASIEFEERTLRLESEPLAGRLKKQSEPLEASGRTQLPRRGIRRDCMEEAGCVRFAPRRSLISHRLPALRLRQEKEGRCARRRIQNGRFRRLDLCSRRRPR